jgi:thioredoxin reductase
VPGIYIAGEMGGMGLIRNAVEQGKQAVENLARRIDRNVQADFDLVIVGAGPTGISASLAARKLNLKAITLEQDSLGGTVFTFPRKKIVMTSPMDLPLYGKVKLYETSKIQLLDLWNEVLSKNEISIQENTKVEQITSQGNAFLIQTSDNKQFTTQKVLLSIGRRGTPRKLNIPGEVSTKVAYRLLEPELITDKKIVVVGGGDSAIESALLLADQNQVTLSYRGDAFGRLKVGNSKNIKEAVANQKIDVRLNTNLKSIEEDKVWITDSISGETKALENDLVYIFAGGELPTQFLEKVGIKITRKFGEAILKHN